MSSENSKLRQYLLGALAAKEMEEIDLRIISDPNLEEELMLVEHELVEDYLEGSLTDRESRQFAGTFQVSAERKALLDEVALLKRYAVAESGGKTVESGSQGAGFLKVIREWLFGDRFVTATVLVVVVMTVFVGVYLILIRNDSTGGLSDLEVEYAKLNDAATRHRTNSKDFSNVSLVPGTFRGGSSAPEYKLDDLTDKILYHLSLPYEPSEGAEFAVSVVRDGKVVFSLPRVKGDSNDGKPEVMVLLPKSILQKGEYQIRVQQTSAGISALTYNLVLD